MASNATRAEILARALRGSVAGDRETIRELFTDDVAAWTSAHTTRSLVELLEQVERRDEAFSDVELDVAALDVGGDYACAEWRVTMTHSGPLVLAGGQTVEPSGAHVTLHGVTVAEFRDERICSLRQYWDEFTVLEQLGLLSAPGSA